MTRCITTMGAALMAEVGRLGRAGMFLGQTLLHCLTPPVKGERVLRQTWFIGWKSMLVIALAGTFTGMVVALQGFPTLRRVGSEALLGPMVSLSLIRELGPVLTALFEDNQCVIEQREVGLDTLATAIETGTEDGMINFNQALYNLVKQGQVSERKALSKATNPQALEMNFKGIFLDEGHRILA